MTTINEAIRNAVQESGFEAECAAHAERRVRYMLKSAKEDLGPGCRGAYNHPRFARFWSETMGRLLVPSKDWRASVQDTEEKVLDEAKLAAYAASYGKAAVAEVVAKLEAKLAGLETATVDRLNGFGSFQISGTKAGRRVRIEQTTIVNVSSLGKVFNQYPALIYVDGKKTSAAAYARI